ncbi:MAG: hypothetical protein JNM83_14020 [Myxococcales bacterium]|jgi:hypothetical protein|nr:hypothetical protein [Myxococcales bacterium]
MSRAIQVTRLHAINWYGYRDSFDVTGNLLIAGIRGSGKSVLMDLVQYVIIANHQKVRYNLSATGDHSTRDLKGYCLGDTKQEENGVPKYMRNGGITYVALEFTWPDPASGRVETWGVRIEYESATQTTPSVKPFLIPASVKREFFLDAEKMPLELLTFRARTESMSDSAGAAGRIFVGVDEYRREMALPSHLNFDRPTIDYLLPTAMSFTFMDSFNQFCRRYILPPEIVDIQSAKDSYLVFRNLEAELDKLHKQQGALQEIHDLDQQRQKHEGERIVARYLEAECRRDHAQEEQGRAATKVRDLQRSLDKEEERRKVVDSELAAAQRRITSIERAFNESADGKLYRRITQENEELGTSIEALEGLNISVQEARTLRLRKSDKWREKLVELELRLTSSLFEEHERACRELRDAAEPDVLQAATDRVADAAKALDGAAAEALRPASGRYSELGREIRALEERLTAIRAGTLLEDTVLLTALRKGLPRRSSAPSVQALWQLCEVTDEAWRPALEVVFTQKYALVVGDEDFDEAQRIYHALKEDASREALINPSAALRLYCEPQDRSLAMKLEVPTGNRIAMATITHLFGDLICVDSVDDFRYYEQAVTIDGFLWQRPFVRRYRHYDNRPCIGKRGLEKQRAHIQIEIQNRTTEQKQLQPILDGWHHVQSFFTEGKLDSQKLHANLTDLMQLPRLRERLSRNNEELKTIDSQDLAQKEQDLREAQGNAEKLSDERDILLKSVKQHQLAHARSTLTTAESDLGKKQDIFLKISGVSDVSRFLNLLKSMQHEVLTAYPGKDVAADRFNKIYTDADREEKLCQNNIVNARKNLAASPEYGTRFADFDPEALTNSQYDQRLQDIRDAHIQDYQAKAAAEKLNWHEIFREQVLEKLRQRLLEVEKLMGLLKAVLDKPIGNERYKITATQNHNKEFKLYRQLLDLSALAHGGSLFATADANLEIEVDRIFKSLTGEKPTKDSQLFLDYRNYFEYDILISNDADPDAKPYSFNLQAGKASGGENQTPYFIAILASYLRAYRRHEQRRREPSLALVPIDEAFSKLSGQDICDCITALKQLELQGVFSMSTGNIPYAIELCDQVFGVHKQQKTKGGKTAIRNIAAALTRSEAIERFGSGRQS